MSFTLKLSSLSVQEKRDILKKFTVSPKKTQYNPNPPIYRCFLADRQTDTLHLPFGMWRLYVDKSIGFPNGDSKHFPKMNKRAKFVGKLYTPQTDPSGRNRDQVPIVEEALMRLKTRGFVFMALYTGMGKTTIAVYLSIVLGLKTVVFCHYDVVRRQWPKEYDVLSGGTIKVQFVEGSKTKLNLFADVYIIGIETAKKMNTDDFAHIGTIIIDETHKKTVAAFTKCAFKCHPRYLIGLSATPDRKDGLHSILNLFYGRDATFIVRREKKSFTVYKYKTAYKPNVQYVQRQGRVVPDWSGKGGVIDSIERNEDRWQEIVDICLKHPREKIIIMCQRNVLATGVYNLLVQLKEDVEILIGNKKKWNTQSRILVAGIMKAGEGMNDPNLTMAIIASDVSDVRQIEGRIRTKDNIIYHIVDDYSSFEKHYELCNEWYLQKGATIETIYGKNATPQDTELKSVVPRKKYLPRI